jgi:hypothetical protein
VEVQVEVEVEVEVEAECRWRHRWRWRQRCRCRQVRGATRREELRWRWEERPRARPSSSGALVRNTDQARVLGLGAGQGGRCHGRRTGGALRATRGRTWCRRHRLLCGWEARRPRPGPAPAATRCKLRWRSEAASGWRQAGAGEIRRDQTCTSAAAARAMGGSLSSVSTAGDRSAMPCAAPMTGGRRA